MASLKKIPRWLLFRLNRSHRGIFFRDGALDAGKMEPEMEGEPITKKSIMTFYNRYRRRKIKPYLKSEPVPTEQEGPVTKVVGDNF